MGIISAPGGIAVTTTDACLEMGLAVPQFTQATANKLRASMPLVGGSVANPIDLSLASVLGPHVYRDALRISSTRGTSICCLSSRSLEARSFGTC